MNCATSSSWKLVLRGQAAQETRPALVVDQRRILVPHTHLRAAGAHRGLAGGLGRAARGNAPGAAVGAIGLHGRADEPGRIAGLEHGRTSAVTVEEHDEIVGIGELVHHVRADHQHGAQVPVGGDEARGRGHGRGKRRARAADVERAGVGGAELVLHHHRRGRRGVVGRVAAEQDQIHVLGTAAGALERLSGGVHRQIRGRPLIGGVEAAQDAGAGLELVDDLTLAPGGKPLAQDIIAHLERGRERASRDDTRKPMHILALARALVALQHESRSRAASTSKPATSTKVGCPGPGRGAEQLRAGSARRPGHGRAPWPCTWRRGQRRACPRVCTPGRARTGCGGRRARRRARPRDRGPRARAGGP